MKLPTISDCYQIWDKYEMPENIRAHTRAVARVADAVASEIARQGVSVDVELVNRGALLHDIAKLRGIQCGKDVHHTDQGAAIVLQEGFSSRLAEVVRLHGLDEFSFDLSIEEQIVNYADRRVVHDRIVSLEERLQDLHVRYSAAARIIEKKRPLYRGFERKYHLRVFEWP